MSTLQHYTIAGEVAQLVTAFVPGSPGWIAEVLRLTGAIPAVPLRAPCIIIQAEVGVALDRSAISWLGDLERCLGWAWVERSRHP